MNLPFRTTYPARVVITREEMERVERAIELTDSARETVNRAVELLETGRAGKAAEILRELREKLR